MIMIIKIVMMTLIKNKIKMLIVMKMIMIRIEINMTKMIEMKKIIMIVVVAISDNIRYYIF